MLFRHYNMIDRKAAFPGLRVVVLIYLDHTCSEREDY